MGNKGQISGILSIVSGVMALLGALCMLFVVAFMTTILEMAFEMDSFYPYDAQTFANFMNMFYGTTGIVLAILGIFGIIGGVFAIKRKYWGLGLAAAIVSIITFFPCGIAATVLIAMGKSEFDKPKYATPVMTSSSVQPPPQS
jgi:hypothetical protein